ncbi:MULTISPECIES: phage tail protein [Myxococcus]|uniref:phage tail protein n=1 Tax=Myxococcus TaxID=32 RepID=UPI00112C37CC|nr:MULTISPECIES: phage tail protein [Myxococcus]QDE90130.1 phage tail protein [Myxococcus xanthus]QDF05006.1 phage tail protein [Myxococcus xanthus]WAM28509.1 phage tail protein [Myxococcus sp. NMCA1]
MTATAPTYRKPIGLGRKIHKRIRLGDDSYDICEPSQGDKVAMLAAARKAGEMNAKNEVVEDITAWNFIVRVASTCLYHPGGVRRVFGDEDLEVLRLEAWIQEYQADFLAAFGGPTVEEAKGNSETTPN